MKSGLIVYNRVDADKNQWFIQEVLNQLNNDNISISFLDESFLLDYAESYSVDFVIYRGRDYKLVEELESKGIIVFNNALTNKIANDKYLTYQLLKSNQLPYIPTFLDISSFTKYPIVMKSVSGHGGNEVYLIDKIIEQKAILEQNPQTSFIYQEYLSNQGDVRLYLLDNKVIAAVKRKNLNDFRNNYSLGGEASLFDPSEEMKNDAIKVSKLLNAAFIGVDFLLTDDGFRIIEIEDPVGSRMLYQTSDIDIISLYCEMIKRRI